MRGKFKLGDKVRFRIKVKKYGVPEYILEERQKRSYPINFIFYDDKLQANLYYIGKLRYGFRSYQLKRVKEEQETKIGRPTTRQRKRRKTL